MYTRRTSYFEAPGRWITNDGEYEFLKIGKTWIARSRYRNRIIGSGPTLATVFALAARHYVHPVVPVDRWEYPSVQPAEYYAAHADPSWNAS
jgi:hypothetical protein